MKAAILITVLGAILAAAIWFAAQSFLRMEMMMTAHGWIALGLGATISLILGAGLMALVFFSHRRGYDDIDDDY